MSFSFSIYLSDSYYGKQVQLIFIVHDFESLGEQMKVGSLQLISKKYFYILNLIILSLLKTRQKEEQVRESVEMYLYVYP